ncbi:MAG: hypothetical protein SWQ30_22655 [Thermodesulfobacteriota bacterium]|nr:hypothetical protein [Thermodesulfobacteriota bacterium]
MFSRIAAFVLIVFSWCALAGLPCVSWAQGPSVPPDTHTKIMRVLSGDRLKIDLNPFDSPPWPDALKGFSSEAKPGYSSVAEEPVLVTFPPDDEPTNLREELDALLPGFGYVYE